MRNYRSKTTVQAFRWMGWEHDHPPDEAAWVVPVTHPNLNLFVSLQEVEKCGYVVNPKHLSLGHNTIVRPGQWVVRRSLPFGAFEMRVLDDEDFQRLYVGEKTLDEESIERVEDVLRDAWGGRVPFSPYTIRRIISASLGVLYGQ